MVRKKTNGVVSTIAKKPHKPGLAKSANPARASKWLVSDPEWEAMKARCRNLTHQDAVRESEFLSAQYRRMWRWRTMAQFKIDLDQILRALKAKKVPFVLTGAYGISGWTGRPRSTHDVDILVRSGRNHARAVKALRELYPELEVRQLSRLTAFFVPGEKESVIDVAFPNRDDQAVTLETGIWVEERGQRYRVPSLECALANKYGAMLSVTRDSIKRSLDAVDFSFMVKHSMDEGRQPVDLEKLAELGEKVWPGGGGKEIIDFVNQAKAGNVPNIAAGGKLP